MKLLTFFNATLVHTQKGLTLTLIFFLTNINIANATSVVVNIEDMGLYNWDMIEKKLPGFGSNGPISLNWDPNNDLFTELLAFNSGYSGGGAAFCFYGEGCALELSVSDENTPVVLESFFLGYFGDEGIVEYDVIDLATETSILFGAPRVSGDSGSLITVDATSSTGFRILFGPDGFNGGINNIAYSYNSILNQEISVIPIPAAVWLFGSSLLGLIGFTRQPISIAFRRITAMPL